MGLLKGLSAFYEFEVKDFCGQETIFIKGTEKELRMGEKKILFAFGNTTTPENIEGLIEQGKAIAITGNEFYRLFFNWSEEEYVSKVHGLDMRTYNFFERVKENIMFVESKRGHEEIEFENPYKMNIWINSSEVEVGVVERGLWCAQYGYRTAIDDYIVERHYFKREPTKANVWTIVGISELGFKFKFGRLKPVVNCWECEREFHWMEIDGDLIEKMNHLEERYCGC